MKLLVDMNLSPRWTGMLAGFGFEAVHWSTLGAILTATQGEKPSVVQIRSEDVSPDVIGKQVVAALKQMETELEEGALLTVDPTARVCVCCPCSQNSHQNSHEETHSDVGFRGQSFFCLI